MAGTDSSSDDFFGLNPAVKAQIRALTTFTPEQKQAAAERFEASKQYYRLAYAAINPIEEKKRSNFQTDALVGALGGMLTAWRDNLRATDKGAEATPAAQAILLKEQQAEAMKGAAAAPKPVVPLAPAPTATPAAPPATAAAIASPPAPAQSATPVAAAPAASIPAASITPIPGPVLGVRPGTAAAVTPAPAAAKAPAPATAPAAAAKAPAAELPLAAAPAEPAFKPRFSADIYTAALKKVMEQTNKPATDFPVLGGLTPSKTPTAVQIDGKGAHK